MGCTEYGLQGGTVLPRDPVTSSNTSQLASAPGRFPVARAGADKELVPLDVAELDGTRSYDLDGVEIVEYAWVLTDRPEGSTTELSDPSAPDPQLFLDLAGEYRLTLTVANAKGTWDPTPDEVVLTATPADRLYVQLSWDATNDLDLHLLSGDMDLFGYEDCNYCNMRPRWGERGTNDDPSLDWDAIQGYGPETITIDEPADGLYAVAAHYYGEGGLDKCKDGCEPSKATVHIYVGGVLLGKFVRQMDDQGDLWNVATITWNGDADPPAQIREVDALDHTDLTYCHP